MVLYICFKFNVSNSIFEAEDLFQVLLKNKALQWDYL